MSNAGKSIEKFAKKAVKPLSTILTGGASLVAEKALDSLTPDMPDINVNIPDAPQQVMPDQEELRKARRRRGSQATTGRASTILSDSGKGLGG